MLCRVTGAKVYKHKEEETEIGYYPVRPTEKGLALSRDCGVDWPSYVYHWHREGFDLPKGAELFRPPVSPSATRVGFSIQPSMLVVNSTGCSK